MFFPKRKKRKIRTVQKNNPLIPLIVVLVVLCFSQNKIRPEILAMCLCISVITIVFLLKFAKKWYNHYRYKKSVLSDVDKMTGTEFEEWLCLYFEDKGFVANHVGQSGDYGADLILRKKHIRTAVQAKRYNGKVGVKAVQEIISAKEYYCCNNAMLVTNSYLTKPALEMASRCNVQVIDRDRLFKM